MGTARRSDSKALAAYWVMQLSIVLDSGRGEGASAREFIECVGRDFLGFGQRVCLGAVLGASGEEV